MAAGTGQEARALRQYYEANNLLDNFRDKLLEEKALNYLVQGAKILEAEAEKIKKTEDKDTPTPKAEPVA